MTVHVMMSGGGGSGGGSLGAPGSRSVGGGGASGAALDFTIESPSPITGGPVVIGAGGIGSPAGAQSGAPTSVTINGVVFLADRGNPGAIVTGAVGDTLFAAGGNIPPGSSPVVFVTGDNGSLGGYSPAIGAGGNGGSGAFGIGGRGFAGGPEGPGLPATVFGAGGGGALSLTTSQAGGNGAPGVVIIEEYT